MGQLFICDICGMPIKSNTKKYVLALEEINRNKIAQYTNALDYLNSLLKQYQGIQTKEICDNCKRILDYFFKLRKMEIEFLNKNIDNFENNKNKSEESLEEEYCTCQFPEPNWDEFPTIKCNICGKIIDPYKKLPEIE